MPYQGPAASKVTVIDQTYELLLYIVPFLAQYPRTQKFLLADRIQTQLMELLEILVEAYYRPKAGKAPLLREANLRVEKLRYLVRLSKDLQCINLRRYGVISRQLDDIGRAVGGWLKKVPSPQIA